MSKALGNVKCHFVGQLEQKTTKNGKPEFIAGQEEVNALPESSQHQFALLKDFRVDIGSTELQLRLEQQKKQPREPDGLAGMSSSDVNGNAKQ